MSNAALLCIPERWRLAHLNYAAAHGYFWIPCPLCGYEFGGHEWRHIDGKRASVYLNSAKPTTGTAICPPCTRAGKGEDIPGVTDLICFCAECVRWRDRNGIKAEWAP